MGICSLFQDRSVGEKSSELLGLGFLGVGVGGLVSLDYSTLHYGGRAGDGHRDQGRR